MAMWGFTILLEICEILVKQNQRKSPDSFKGINDFFLVPSIRELIKPNKEAILIDPYNVEELKQAILQLYDDLDLRTELSLNAKEKVKLYDVDKVYGQILKVYDELVGCKAKSSLRYSSYT